MAALHSTSVSPASLQQSLVTEVQSGRSPWQQLPEALALTPFERFVLRNDTAATPMVFRVILSWKGECRRDLLSTAYEIALRQQPFLNTRLDHRERGPHWVEAETPLPLQWLPDSLQDDQLRDWPLDPIDITSQTALRSFACQRPGRLDVLCDFHHACTDGQGGRQFVLEWLGIYQQLLAGADIRLHGLDHGRLANRSTFIKPEESVGGAEGLRNLYLTIKGRNVSLPQRTLSAGTPLATFREHPFTEEETARMRESLRRQRLTMNDVGLAAAFEAFHEMYSSHVGRRFISVANPVDLRRPSDLRMPACNRIGFAFIRRQKKEWREHTELVQSLRDQLQYVKRKFVGVEFLNGLTAADGLPGMVGAIHRLGWFTPTMQFTSLGDLTRVVRYPLPFEDGEMTLGGLRLHHVSGFPPLGVNVPLSLSACETSNRLSLAVRASGLYLTVEETEQFTAAFAETFQRMLKQ